jgi:cytochrome c peroxidase
MRNYYQNLIIVIVLFLLCSCIEREETIDDALYALKLEALPEVKYPANNPVSPAKIKLGKLLFFDPILSGEKDVSCASCHHPALGYADGLDLFIGVGGEGTGTTDRKEKLKGRIPTLGRNSPSVLNVAYNGLLSYHQRYSPLDAPMFWDSRGRSLESQSLGPPTSFDEMRGDAYPVELTYDSLIARLNNIPEYVELFQEAFKEGDASISKENLGKAIATFERSIVSKNSPYDQFVKGNHNALSPMQKEGLLLFFTKANCVNCHSGPMFSDFNLYNLGINHNPRRIEPDNGMQGAHKFRTPTLRNISLTAPYMHNGMHESLEDVMNYYNNGVSENKDIQEIDSKIQPLNLTSREIHSIIAFMNSLTDESFDKEIPERVPSGLKPGGN